MRLWQEQGQDVTGHKGGVPGERGESRGEAGEGIRSKGHKCVWVMTELMGKQIIPRKGNSFCVSCMRSSC